RFRRILLKNNNHTGTHPGIGSDHVAGALGMLWQTEVGVGAARFTRCQRQHLRMQRCDYQRRLYLRRDDPVQGPLHPWEVLPHVAVRLGVLVASEVYDDGAMTDPDPQ